MLPSMLHAAGARALLLILLVIAMVMPGCARPGSELHRRGDEIVVCGRYFHTGAPVVLWTDPGGYDAYRTEKRFVPWEKAQYAPPPPPPADKKSDGGGGVATPNRYNIRFAGSLGQPYCPLTAEDFEHIRGGGWDLPTLQRCVDQFVLHYDVCGTSRQCFRVLHDMRGLSVHFMLDIDGTIYQTLDLKERAWHATTSNDRSIGIEIANIGAYPPLPDGSEGRGEGSRTFSGAAPLPSPLTRWYDSTVFPPRITIPPELGDGGVRLPGPFSPAAAAPVVGVIQNQELVQYDFTPQQYRSLERLTATLCKVFPNLPRDYPRDADGNLITTKLPDDQLADYHGILGHYHIQLNKTDPGPALQWERVIGK